MSSSNYQERVRLRNITAGWIAALLTAAIIVGVTYAGCHFLGAKPSATTSATVEQNP